MNLSLLYHLRGVTNDCRAIALNLPSLAAGVCAPKPTKPFAAEVIAECLIIMFNISIVPISIYIRSNALYNSTGNHYCPNHYFTIIAQKIKSSQMLVFDERGKPENSGRKPVKAE